MTTNQNIGKAVNVLRLLTDEQIPSEILFGIVRQKVFQILGKDEINQFAELVLQENQFDEINIAKIIEEIKHLPLSQSKIPY